MESKSFLASTDWLCSRSAGELTNTEKRLSMAYTKLPEEQWAKVSNIFSCCVILTLSLPKSFVLQVLILSENLERKEICLARGVHLETAAPRKSEEESLNSSKDVV